MRDHHMNPQEMLDEPGFFDRIQAAGISKPKRYIDKQIARIPHAFHADIHKKGWNDDWKTWFRYNKKFTTKDLQKQIKLMMQKYNIPKATRNLIRRYGKNGKRCGG
ncbi:DUF2380 domain-containing protein [Pseudomonas alabamensis]|uniref:DUF2380 domain-containing protein n=1 Tax=Pseudomonas alabamensis TaxID=3064349 RepID=UPI003D161160